MFNFQATTQPSRPGVTGHEGLHAGGREDPLAATQNLAQAVQLGSLLASSDSRAGLPRSTCPQNGPPPGQQLGHQVVDAQTRNNASGNYNALQTDGGKALSGLLSSKASDGNAASEHHTGAPTQRQKRKYRPVLVKSQKNPIAMGETLKLHQERSMNRGYAEQGSAPPSLDHSAASLDKLPARRGPAGGPADLRALAIERARSSRLDSREGRAEKRHEHAPTSRTSGAGTPLGQQPSTRHVPNGHGAAAPDKDKRPPLDCGTTA